MTLIPAMLGWKDGSSGERERALSGIERRFGQRRPVRTADPTRAAIRRVRRADHRMSEVPVAGPMIEAPLPYLAV